MGKKAKAYLKNASHIADLCNELLQLCDTHIEHLKTAGLFRRLYEITSTIRNLQKGLSISHTLLAKDREVCLNALQRRYKECIDSPLSICNYEASGFGMRSDAPIEINSRLLHLPLNYVLSVSSVSSPLPDFLVKDPLFLGMSNVALSVVVLHELSLGDKSNWKEYLCSLPATYSTVAYFSDAEFEILNGFPTGDVVLNAYRNICRQYAYFYLLFERMKQTDSLPIYMNRFCFEDYQWAVSTVMSRNNALPVKGHDDEKLLCLIPLWDMLNHKHNRVTTDYDPTSEYILFYAMESYQKGEEVFMDYGKRTSTEFLLYSGFVPEYNSFHKVPFRLGLSKFDKFLTLRAQILDKLGLGSEISLLISHDAFPTPQLSAFARVFVMNEAELQITLDELISSESGGSLNATSLLSVGLSNNRVNEEAKKFIEGRIKLLIHGYESRLHQNLQSVPLTCQLREHCVRLCRHDITELSLCLAALSGQSN